jgi:hypothetical protein
LRGNGCRRAGFRITYSYAYTTMGKVVAMGVAACLLREYGVSMSATAIG